MPRKRTPVVTGMPAKDVPVGNVVSATVNGLNGVLDWHTDADRTKGITVRLLKCDQEQTEWPPVLHQKMSGYI